MTTKEKLKLAEEIKAHNDDSVQEFVEQERSDEDAGVQNEQH